MLEVIDELEAEEVEDEDEEEELTPYEREFYSDPELMYGDISKFLEWKRKWEMD